MLESLAQIEGHHICINISHTNAIALSLLIVWIIRGEIVVWIVIFSLDTLLSFALFLLLSPLSQLLLNFPLSPPALYFGELFLDYSIRSKYVLKVKNITTPIYRFSCSW